MSEPVIPYGRQWVDEDDIAAVGRVLRSDYLTTGPAVETFESALATATSARRAVVLNSGTSALHAMYFAVGLGPGDEVITSPLTFAATANAARYLGADVRFADVEPDTGNLDAKSVETQISPRTRLIVAVDYAGHPADYDALCQVARTHQIPLVADAAHSLGASYRGRRVGALCDGSALSFHPVKAITTGEGGAVVTDDDALADRATRFRAHGITRDVGAMDGDDGGWWYEMHDLGFNYRLTDLQAALGASQLGKLDDFLRRRRWIAARYQEALADVDGLELPVTRGDVEPAWHLYVVRVRAGADRRALFDRLRDAGLGVQVHYIPVYWHPYYQGLGHRRGACQVAEDFYARAISLPIFPRLTDAEVDRTVSTVRAAALDML